MATLTLLQMTQNILSALDSDEVNSISDTVESLQVATIIQNKYYDILSRGNLPEQSRLLQLTASGDAAKPTLMTLPAGMSRIDWIKYFDSDPADGTSVTQFGAYSHSLNVNITSTTSWLTTSSTSVTIGTGTKDFTLASTTLPIAVNQGVMAINGTNSMFGVVVSYNVVGAGVLRLNVTGTSGSGTFATWTIFNSTANTLPGYKYVTGLAVDEFLDMINRFNPSDSDVRSFTFTEQTGNAFTFYYKNDKQPQYYTVIENKYVIFDSYSVSFDTTLQSSKTLVFGQYIPPFTLSDSFIPNMDDNQFPLLLNEAKSLAFYELKQMPHLKADQEIKRQWNTVQKNKMISQKPTSFDAIANFGRVPRTGGYSGGGYGAYKWMRQAGP